MLHEHKDDSIPMKRSFPGRPTSYLSYQHRQSPVRQRGLNLSMHATQDKSQQRIRQGSQGQEIKKHQIFFSRAKKYNYMKEIIDKYFDETKGTKFYQRSNPEDVRIRQHSTIIPRIIKPAPQPQERQVRFNGRPRLREKKSEQVNEQLQISQMSEGRLICKEESQSELTSASMAKSTSVGSTINNSSLPPISELFEEKDGDYASVGTYESLSLMSESRIEQEKEEKVQLFDNLIYSVEMIVVKGRPSHRLKRYKEKGYEILTRQMRAIRLGIGSIWQQYRYDSHALISPPVRPIKDLLFKAKRVDVDAKFYTLKPRQYHRKLMTSNCEELVRVVRDFCEFMKKWEGKVLNNKVNTSNLFVVKNDNWRLGQWGFSSFREKHMIQDMEFHNCIEPIIKSQKEWFVPPEHLAPQIVRAVVFNEEQDLMSQGAASDIWSLGVAILEILTVIPVWMAQKCTVYGRSMTPRSGILSVGQRDLRKLLRKEEKLPYLARRLIEEECGEQTISEALLQVVVRCIEFDPGRRPTYEQILQMLK